MTDSSVLSAPILSESSARKVAVLGIRVRMERNAAGMTRATLARKLGLDAARLEGIENGDVRYITATVVDRIAATFKIEASALIDRNAPPPPEPFHVSYLSPAPVEPDGKALRSRRRRALVTRKRLAHTLGLPVPQIRATEKGLATPAYTLARICTALGVQCPRDMVVGDVPDEAVGTLEKALPFGINLVAPDPAVV